MAHNEKCKAPGCDRFRTGKIFCASHYIAGMQGKFIGIVDFEPNPYCEFTGCENRSQARAGGLCQSHIKQRGNLGKLTPLRNWSNQKGACGIDDCDSDAIAKGFCARHYQIARNYKLNAEQMNALPKICDICGKGGRLNIDHDHSCCPGPQTCGNCLRGVLCYSCNVGMGHIEANINRLEDMLAYVEKYGMRNHSQISGR